MEILSVNLISFAVVMIFTEHGAAQTQRDTFADTRRCPDPFFYINGKCYWFYSQANVVTWNQAESMCATADARLARVTNRMTQSELSKWITRHEYRLMSYWIGLHKVDESAEFRWHGTNQEAMFTSWAGGQHDHETSEKCVALSGNRNHKWVAVNCRRRNLFICEKEIESGALQADIDRSASPMEKFCKYRTNGYYPDPSDCRNYILCFGKKLSKYRCFNNEIFNPVTLMCGTQISELCHMEPKTTTTTSAPPTDGPDNPDYYGEGDDYDEDDDEYYENYGEDANTMTDEDELGEFPEYSCEDQGYLKLGKKCYKVYYNRVSWNVANQICIGEQHGRLATIKSKRTQVFLWDELKKRVQPRSYTMIINYWIGLNDQKTPDTYVWSDGTTLTQSTYQNWSRNARKRHRNLKKCVQITMLSKGRWEDSMCADENGYICEKDAVNPSVPDPVIEPVVPAGWKARNSLCGTNRCHNLPEAVVGGTTADMEEHPWQVSLRSLGKHQCGGTLIDSCWVLTAAHCVDISITGQRHFPTLVVVGDVDTYVPEGTEKYLRIERVILHPNFTTKPVSTNDIALLKLGACVDDFNPICLPGDDFDKFGDNHVCKVAGWGTMDPTVSDYPSRLQEAAVPILPQYVCRRKYVLNRQSLIQEGMICAGYVNGRIDACQGDSGGPLACRGPRSSNQAVQWGIVSWGFGCARRNKPGVYTKVAHYMDWIRNETRILF